MSTASGHGGHGGEQSPMKMLWVSMTGASADDHHEEAPGLDPVAQKVGHEVDEFNVKGIIYVPIAVTLTLVVTYLIVQGMFAFVNGTASRQETGPTHNERVAKIATADGDAKVAAPRLEFFRRIDTKRNGKDDPAFLRSFKSLPTGNSPEIYPQDLQPHRYTDPATGKKVLAEPTEVVKDKVVTIPIDVAIELATTDAKYKVPAATTEAPTGGTMGKGKLSTGGVPTKLEPKPIAEKKDENKDQKKH